jgi:hypothetical protein
VRLAESFHIDACEPWVVAHNQEVREVTEAFHRDRPIRVPLFAGDAVGQHGPYADDVGLDHRRYYTDPDEMIRVQLEAARLRRELPIYDLALAEAPAKWPASVDLWPVVAPGWVGCRILYRERSVIAHRSMHLTREEADALAMPDPLTGGLVATSRRFWQYLRETYGGKLTFLGRPVGPIGHGVGTNGPFSLALDIRGAAIMQDMYEHPEFARRFLRKVYTWCDALERAWAAETGSEVGGFGYADHGIDMLSPQTYEAFLVPLIVEMNERRGSQPGNWLHHCGRGAHLFPVIKKHFGLTTIHALTYPLVNIAKVRREVGEEVWIYGVIEDGIIHQGPSARIREIVKELMASGAKGTGRFALWVGDLLRGVPLGHRRALYEAVREYGRY